MNKHTYEYDINHNGIVFSLSSNWRGHKNRIMKTTLNKDGYEYVRITVNGKRIKRYIHQWVCLKYCGKKPTIKHEVRHLDGDKNNNNYMNLKWGTRKENAMDRVRHGNTYRPDWSNPINKLKWGLSMRKRRLQNA